MKSIEEVALDAANEVAVRLGNGTGDMAALLLVHHTRLLVALLQQMRIVARYAVDGADAPGRVGK